MSRQTDRWLEDELRTLRPRAPERMVVEIVGRFRAGRRVRIGSPRFVTAALLTAAMLVAMGSVGGVGYAASATRTVAVSVASIVAPPSESRRAERSAPAAKPQSDTKSSAAGQSVTGGPARPAASPERPSSRSPAAPGDTGGDPARTGRLSVTSQQSAGKIAICHATGSATNPYVLITVSVSGLAGHSGHPGDLIPVPSDGCPDESPAEDQYKPGKGCGDDNHVHFKEGQCGEKDDDE